MLLLELVWLPVAAVVLVAVLSAVAWRMRLYLLACCRSSVCCRLRTHVAARGAWKAAVAPELTMRQHHSQPNHKHNVNKHMMWPLGLRLLVFSGATQRYGRVEGRGAAVCCSILV